MLIYGFKGKNSQCKQASFNFFKDFSYYYFYYNLLLFLLLLIVHRKHVSAEE